MKKYLDAVKSYCSDLEKRGKIAPLLLDYPSFKISQRDYKKAILDYATERVKIGLFTGDYGNKKFSKDIDYETLFETEDRISRGIESAEDLGNKLYLEKILPKMIGKDVNLEERELFKNGLKDVCVMNMQHILMSLEDMRVNSLSYDRHEKGAVITEKDKFVASMIMIKEQFPYAYKALENMMDSSGFTELVQDLKKLYKEPDVCVVTHLMEKDSKMAIEKFPQMVRSIKDREKITFDF